MPTTSPSPGSPGPVGASTLRRASAQPRTATAFLTASGAMVTSIVEITLSQPEGGIFTIMTMVSSDSSGNNSYTSTYTYPSLWPIKAY